jgi:hypothetical protein
LIPHATHRRIGIAFSDFLRSLAGLGVSGYRGLNDRKVRIFQKSEIILKEFVVLSVQGGTL